MQLLTTIPMQRAYIKNGNIIFIQDASRPVLDKGQDEIILFYTLEGKEPIYENGMFGYKTKEASLIPNPIT